ncbi:TetR/AcrR family transcriptional regulator [Alkaliphilus transvaalensis]|uniref:TetR/AcrR family transcriptional regulator n=1 Tax=Alkaliphilus transvaalensis TaxID=114628 RepID=UPI00047D7D70|nr:TetR/AcrR family transcriptional regulator [Alkaliphilus transvaalensis]
MPKDTFYNLIEEKQKKIFSAAVEEFSTKRYSEASINQIIKNAGIPRGSFYQYFENKEDLYLYVLTEIGKEKMNVAKNSKQLKPDADFFDTYLHMLEMILTWAEDNPKYYQIGALMDMDDSDFITNLRENFPDGFQLLKDQIEIDKKRGLIKPDVDANAVIDLIYALNLSFVKEFYKTRSAENLLKKTMDFLKIIKGGISSV